MSRRMKKQKVFLGPWNIYSFLISPSAFWRLPWGFSHSGEDKKRKVPKSVEKGFESARPLARSPFRYLSRKLFFLPSPWLKIWQQSWIKPNHTHAALVDQGGGAATTKKRIYWKKKKKIPLQLNYRIYKYDLLYVHYSPYLFI